MLRKKRQILGIILIYLTCLTICWFFIGAWVQDDSFISFRYSENLIKGEGLVYNSGEYVQGYTNFLWIVILGGISYFGTSFNHTALLLNVIFTLITGISVVILISGGKNNTFRPVFAALLFLSAPNVLCWTVGGGLEGPFFTMMLFFGCYELISGTVKGSRKFIYSGILFALTTLIRPEGILLFVAAIIAYLILFRHYYIPNNLVMGIIVYFAIIIPYIFVCYLYYDSVIPNTFYAKTITSIGMIIPGLHYAYRFYMSVPILTALFLLSIVSFHVLPVVYKFIDIMIIIITLYVILIGGDFMAAGRFFLPAMPFLAISASDSFLNILMGRKVGRRDNTALIYATGLIIVIFQILSISYFQDYKASILSNIDEKAGIAAGIYLGNTYPGCTVAAGGIGMIGYYSKMRIIDITGLTDKIIAHSTSKIVPSMPQHSRSNSEYVMRQKPELIFFGLPPGRCKPGIIAELEIFNHPDFDNYVFRKDITQNGDTINYYLRKGYLVK